jgi:hypothetical protein
MFECWNDFGEGKLDIFGIGYGELGLKPEKSSCVICSRIGFDEGLGEELRGVDVNGYLARTEVKGTGLTYLQHFTDESVKAYPEVDESAELYDEARKAEIIGGDKVEELAVVFMQIPTSYGEVGKNLVAAGFGVAGGTFITPGAGSLAKRLIPTPLRLVGVVVGGLFVASNVHEGLTTAASYCGEFVSGDRGEDGKKEAQKGCSVVQVMPYDFRAINSFCGGGLQGRP